MNGVVLLLAKELRIEWRRRELVAGGLVLAFLVILIGNLAWRNLPDATTAGPGVLWVSFVFASVLMLGRSIHAEHDRGTWDAMASLPLAWHSIFFAKTLANLIFLLVVEAAALVSYVLLFGHDILPILGHLVLVVVLGSVGLVAAGTLFSAISAHGRNREILLPLMLLPVLFPLLMMAIQATQKVMDGLTWQRMLPELELILAFDAIYLSVGWLVFEHVVGD